MGQSPYDHVVVGAGTAGCVIASRLSERPGVRVLLLEAGARDTTEAMASPWGVLGFDPSSLRMGASTVQAGTGRAADVLRGKALGGSSSINGLYHLRGHRSADDEWPGLGAPGWGFGDLLPYFRRSESTRGRDASVRGTDGPVVVAPVPQPHPLATAGVDAAVQAGFTRADDIGGGLETGFGWSDVNLPGGARQSAADAYIRPFLERPNLDVVTDATVQRLRITAGRCTGTVRLADDHPASAPVVDPGYLSDDRGLAVMRKGLATARRIGEADAFADWRKQEAVPGSETSGESVEEFIRKASGPYFHFTGTCRMGTDADAVVDPANLRVHGIAGLRVADASVMPSIPSANTNATVYAIAERAAELLD